MEPTSTPGAATPTSTPSAAPSATSSPAPTPASTPSTPVASPGVSEPSTPAAPDTRSTEQILIDKLTPAFDPNGVGGAPAKIKIEEIQNGDAEAAAVVPPAVEAAKPGEEVTPPAAADTEDAFTLEEPTHVGPKALTDFLDAKPELKKVLEADPEAKAAFYANARRAERATQLEAIVGSPAEAQVYVSNATAFMGVSGKIAEVKDGDNASYYAAMNEMLNHSALLDESGNPVKNEDGSIKTDGSVGRLMKNGFRMNLDRLYVEAQKNADDDTMAAIDIIMERSGLRPSTAGNEDDMSEELKARVAEVKRGEEALQTQRQTQREADLAASTARVDSNTDHFLDTTMRSIMGKATALDAFARTAAEREIRLELGKELRNNQAFRSARTKIEARALGPVRERDLSKLMADTITEKMPAIARRVLAKAGVSIQTKEAERIAAQAAREKAAKSESRSSLAPVNPAAPAEDSIEKVTADLKAKNGGREPDLEAILRERMLRKGGAVSAR